jgi:predicted metal-dependent HD superfamily phosphohydrolase
VNLRDRYAQPWRHFHTWEHVERVLKAAEWYYTTITMGRTPPSGVYSAILWHDAVYLPGATDNERKSADLYRDQHKGYQDCRMTLWVQKAIQATATHEPVIEGLHGVHGPINVMLSCDLVSLAAPWHVFKQDARNICKEYLTAYDEKVVREGRVHFYEQMAKRKTIYPHPYFEMTHGKRARVNLYRALLEGERGVM